MKYNEKFVYQIHTSYVIRIPRRYLKEYQREVALTAYHDILIWCDEQYIAIQDDFPRRKITFNDPELEEIFLKKWGRYIQNDRY